MFYNLVETAINRWISWHRQPKWNFSWHTTSECRFLNRWMPRQKGPDFWTEMKKKTVQYIYSNSKQFARQKFLQIPFLGCLWSPWRGKIIWSAVGTFYLMICAKFLWRNLQSVRKLLRENQFLKIFISNPYGKSNFFAPPGTPLAS